MTNFLRNVTEELLRLFKKTLVIKMQLHIRNFSHLLKKIKYGLGITM